MQIGKKELHVSLFANDMIAKISAPPNFQPTHTQSVALLYTNDKWAEKEIRETTAFTIVTSNLKYLGGTLTKQMKDLYDKNFKAFKKEFRIDSRT